LQQPPAPGNKSKQLLGDPQVVFEVLSPSTASYDQKVKLGEYRELAGVREIVLVDPLTERIRLVRRTPAGGWTDDWLEDRGDLHLPSLDVTVPSDEISGATDTGPDFSVIRGARATNAMPANPA
jgi:Uma2 family endonuclease